MDPATAAVMLLLSCTPDTLLCRKLPQHAGTFGTVSQCEARLPAEIERLSDGNSRIIGRCEALTDSDSQWAKLPDSTVATALERDERIAPHVPAPVETDQMTTGSVSERGVSRKDPVTEQILGAEELERAGLAVVRVTRIVSGAPVTTAYVVGRD